MSTKKTLRRYSTSGIVNKRSKNNIIYLKDIASNIAGNPSGKSTPLKRHQINRKKKVNNISDFELNWDGNLPDKYYVSTDCQLYRRDKIDGIHIADFVPRVISKKLAYLPNGDTATIVTVNFLINDFRTCCTHELRLDNIDKIRFPDLNDNLVINPIRNSALKEVIYTIRYQAKKLKPQIMFLN